ncbi:hypothetical protein DB30_07377 [Enhygromyxa salina]|uniref:Ferritin-like domain-containing protein n=1 Tax=Enhygromyxa salina TaxID=215803 RepID=A0A0C2CRZ9_9BACT|nr:hypothetical protein [Enhygromyxa salina]KIG13961.1 hypothetical protein DB30_07377 [Enhygromyxa salina]
MSPTDPDWPTDELEAFELELFGEGPERRYRRMRPEVEAMPWDDFDASVYDEDVRLAARAAWTRAAFQEHRTAAAILVSLRAMVEARAPLDLVGFATRFPQDELVHVELCARMAGALGGGTNILHKPQELIRDPLSSLSPLMRAADIVVRLYCVGEAVSIPLLRGAWHAAKHPLPKTILGTIVRDEAAHGTFGFWFLDWALPLMGPGERAELAISAERAIAPIEQLWSEIAQGAAPQPDSEAHPLGWMRTDTYLEMAHAAMQTHVLAPLRDRSIPVRTRSA